MDKYIISSEGTQTTKENTLSIIECEKNHTEGV